nr:alpha-amylase family glycosyl hydrolase [Dongshaea marina]
MKTTPGHCGQLGAVFENNGVNFCLWARLASSVELLLFDSETDIHPKIIPLCPRKNRTAYYWHIFIEGISEGQLYGYRITGPYRPHPGCSFDEEKILLDPYGKEVVLGPNYDRKAACIPGSNIRQCAKNVLVDPGHFDWEGDCSPRHHLSRSVIYELHVGGFTNNENSGVSADKRGTYAGVIEKIPYLQDLGVTAVELLPVYQFDPQDAPKVRSITGATVPCHSSHLTRNSVAITPPLGQSMNFGRWSRRCIRQTSR